MNRVNVTRQGDDGPELVGHFDLDRAEEYDEVRRWDGNNMVSTNTGKYGRQTLYRTAGGRWVLLETSQWAGVEPTWEFLSDERARDWLLRNEQDDVVERYLGEIPEEAGPNLGGRPEIGPAFSVKFPLDLTAALDVEARRRGTSRAALLREAAEALLHGTSATV